MNTKSLLISLILLLTVFIFASSCQPPATTPPTPTWRTLFSTGFEGTFPPTGLTVFDNDGTTNGEYYWSQTNYRAGAGTYCAWAVGGGANGSLLANGANYPNNAQSWAVCGPYNFVGATDVSISLKYWLNTESGFDYLKLGFSTDGSSFSTTSISGNSSGWQTWNVDLSSVKSSILGQPQVWFAIIFRSDGTNNYPEGAYIDDVLIQQLK